MQLERKPEPGQTWQHFKGNIYKILLISAERWELDQLLDFSQEQIKHTETGEILRLSLFWLLNLVRESDNQTIEGKFVIYQRVDPDVTQIWARPYDNFLEIVSSPYIDGVVSNNYYRFNRIS